MIRNYMKDWLKKYVKKYEEEKRKLNFDAIIGQMEDGSPVYNILELVPYLLNNEPNDSLVVLMRKIFQEEDEKRIAKNFDETLNVCSESLDYSNNFLEELNNISIKKTVAETILQFLENKDNDLRLLSALHKSYFSGHLLQ